MHTRACVHPSTHIFPILTMTSKNHWFCVSSNIVHVLSTTQARQSILRISACVSVTWGWPIKMGEKMLYSWLVFYPLSLFNLCDWWVPQMQGHLSMAVIYSLQEGSTVGIHICGMNARKNNQDTVVDWFLTGQSLFLLPWYFLCTGLRVYSVAHVVWKVDL